MVEWQPVDISINNNNNNWHLIVSMGDTALW